MSETQTPESILGWLIDSYLYSPLDLANLTEGRWDQSLDSLRHPSQPVDLYCLVCKRETAFCHSDTSEIELAVTNQPAFLITVSFGCARQCGQVVVFCVLCHNRHLLKIGQFPSQGDLDKPELNNFSRVLAAPLLNELRRGVGLAAHGIGIGSYVYLRRVFEGLIEDATEHAARTGTIDPAVVRKLRMDEKIERLQDFLPEFLVRNRKIYSLLSKGVHELSDTECLAHFPTLLDGIEVILEKQMDQLRLHEREQRAARALDTLAQRLDS